MIRANLQQLAQVCAGDVIAAHAEVHIVGAEIDTRKLKPGQLFVALRGEHVDGHDLLTAATQAGAAAALVARRMPEALPQLVVTNVAQALNAIARYWLDQLPALKRIALTGSNGKTTVKNLSYAILQRVAATKASEGNRNNELGVPLTALSMAPEHRFGVFEMGAGTPGDIEGYCAIVAPHVALVNNIAPAHLERLHSLEGIAETKSGVYRRLLPGGCAVIPHDDAFADYFRRSAGNARQLSFGTAPGAQVRALPAPAGRVQLATPWGSIDTSFALLGAHNQRNAAAAAALALASGASVDAVAQGLSTAEAVAGRFRVTAAVGGGELIDDSYNANPGSFAAGLRTLAARYPHAWVAMGDMAELGAETAQLHAELGALIKQLGVQRLYCYGPWCEHTARAAGSCARHFEQQSELIAALRAEWQSSARADTGLLVKGSRSAAMERVVQAMSGDPTA